MKYPLSTFLKIILLKVLKEKLIKKGEEDEKLKRKRRSIYGTSRPDNYTKHVRRCFRSQKS